MHTVTTLAGKLILVCLLYVVFGRIALLLAIPPGYAMAIYPPAGLALGAVLVGGNRLVLGVGAGSLLLNTWIGWEKHGFNPAGIQIACAISCGAMLQALVSAGMIRKVVGYPLTLDNNLSILQFMLLGGLLGCTINAAVGVTALHLIGGMPASALLNNWLTWWLGDSLGVLTITPAVLILFGEPKSIWQARRVNVLLPLLLTLALVIMMFVFVRQWEQQRMEREFRDRSQRLVAAMQARLDYHIDVQKSVVALFVSIGQINRRQFATFVAQPISNYSALQAIQWAPHIEHAQRDKFEKLASEENEEAISITELQNSKTRLRSAQNNYFPILYVAPQLGNAQMQGFDLASNRVMRKAIEESRDIGLVVASGPLALMPSNPGRLVASLVSPVYDPKRLGVTVAERRQAFAGVVVSILHLDHVLKDVIGVYDQQMVLLKLEDAPHMPDASKYFDNLGELSKSQRSKILSFSLDFAGRELLIHMYPSMQYFQQQQAWAAWAALVGGMLFAGIVGMYLLLVSGRSFGIEALVTERTRQLHDSERRLHVILDNAADGILSIDANGQVVLANRAICELLGYTQQEMSSQYFDTLFFSDGRQMPLEDFLPSDSLASGRSNCEFYGRRKDMNLVPLELSVASTGLEQTALYIVVVHDLTERKRVDQLKGDFVSAVSHELRTPLTSIRGSLGLLVGGVGGNLPEQAARLLKLANDNAERLSALINDLLDFERLEYGGMRFEYGQYNLLEIVRQAIDTNTGYAQKFSVRLQLLPCLDAGLLVQVDEGRLLQVLSNLLSNAIKFSHQHGSVEVEIRREGRRVSVWVHDHGTGIADSFKPRIFEKFTQADASVRRKYAGTGLGLSLAKMMIEKMGGEIGFQSEEGQGASFYIQLPLMQELAPPSGAVLV